MLHTVVKTVSLSKQLQTLGGFAMHRRLTLWLLAAIVSCVLPNFTAAQNIQHSKDTQDLALRHNFTIDPVSLSLNIQITLGEYKGRGASALPISLRYSSKLWRLDYSGYRSPEYGGGLTDDITYTMLSAVYGDPNHDTMTPGWSSSLELPYRIEDPERFRSTGTPCDISTNCADPASNDPHGGGSTALDAWEVRRIRLHMPDGSTHELRADDTVRYYTNFVTYPITYYAVDGSRIRYTELGSGNTPTGSITYLPDGSRYEVGVNGFTGFIDPHGNKLTAGANSLNGGLSWTDALGRSISLDSMPGVNNTTIHYSFIYRRLKDAATGESALTDPSQPLCYYGPGQWSPIAMAPTLPALFDSGTGADRIGSSGAYSDSSGKFNPSVIYQIVSPDGSAYTFTYNNYGEIDKIVYPTGAYEKFEYAPVPGLTLMNLPYTLTNRGVVRRVVSPDGNAANEQEWLYGASEFSTSVLKATTIAPDGTITDRYVHRGLRPEQKYFGFDDARSGMVFEECFYAAGAQRGDRGAMLRRTLTEWGTSQYTVPFPPDITNGSRTVSRDAKALKEIQILLDTHGGNNLAAATVYSYGQASQPLNVTAVKQYGYVSLAPGAGESVAPGSFPDESKLLRKTETVYVDDPAYNARNLVALPLITTVRNAAMQIVSQSAMRYDELAYPIIAYGDIERWADPSVRFDGSVITTAQGTRALGNLTTSRSWLDTTNTWIETHAQYDQAGNVVKAYDAHEETAPVHGRVTESVFTSSYRYAYPEQVKSPAPDPAPDPAIGPQGSSVPLVTLTSYDFNTGLVTSTSDANNQITSFSYVDQNGVPDALNRLRKMTGPDGSWKTYDFGNVPNNFYIHTRTALDVSRATEIYQFFDGLGRPSRAFFSDGATADRTWIAKKTTYDNMGRVVTISNPLFKSDLGDFQAQAGSFRTLLYDALGRSRATTAADGSVATMYYNGNEITVSDPSGKSNRSVSDALGRITDVFEASDANLQTTYVYDAIDNLREVQQGVQRRFFTYDSLRRLVSASNPEFGGGVMSYKYDAAGNVVLKIDPRPGGAPLPDCSIPYGGGNVATCYKYDNLNRLKTRTYNFNTPTVTYFYDGTGVAGGVVNSKGRLTSVKSDISSYDYTSFDEVGHIKSSSQVTDGQTYALPQYQYDLAGNLRSVAYPSGRVVQTSYDAAGRPDGVIGQSTGQQAKSYASSFNYAAHGAIASLKLGNNLWEHTSFNSRLQPTQIALGTSISDASILRLDYTYGLLVNGVLDTTKNNGDVQSQRIVLPNLDVTQSYEYDSFDRLQSAKEMKGTFTQWIQVYKYDRYGNRNFDAGTTFPLLPTTLVDMVANPRVDLATNRLVEDQDANGTKDYQYDAAGNVTKNAQGQTFVYDAENKQITYNNGPDINTGGASYYYDGDGRRVKKVTAGGTSVFVYDAMGQLVAEYSNEAPQPDAGGTKYLTADKLGSPRVTTSQNGSITRHDYAPFGEDLGEKLPATRTAEYKQDSVRKQFTGQERDKESGLDYFNARYYSSVQGRFMSIDPLAASGKTANPQSWNRYAYVLNNPAKLVDTTGMSPTDPPADSKPPHVFVTVPIKTMSETIVDLSEAGIKLRAPVPNWIMVSAGKDVDNIANRAAAIYYNDQKKIQALVQADHDVAGVDEYGGSIGLPESIGFSATSYTVRAQIREILANEKVQISDLREELVGQMVPNSDSSAGTGQRPLTQADANSILSDVQGIAVEKARESLKDLPPPALPDEYTVNPQPIRSPMFWDTRYCSPECPN